VDVVLGGLVTSRRGAFDRRGGRMAFLEREDFTGSYGAIVFADPLERYGEFLVPDAMVLVGGTVSTRGETEPKLLLNRAIPLDQVAGSIVDRVVLDVSDPEVDDAFVEKLRDIGRRRVGGMRTILRVGLRGGELVQVEIPDVRLPASSEALGELEALVGEGGVRLGGLWSPPREASLTARKGL
jgi:DNA polymerase III alpha subunit